jgi:hypothetical protein
MPAGDGTGPSGMGPGTGRGMGYCGGYDVPGWANPGPGRRVYGWGGAGIRGGRGAGYGAGRGGGWGWRNQFYATGQPRWARWGLPPAAAYGASYATPYEPLSRGQEVEMLKDEAEWLRQQLDAISRRMDELSQE